MPYLFNRRIVHWLDLSRKFITNCAGVAAVEMALATPVLLLLLLGTSEIASTLSTHYRAAQLASTVDDAIARYQTITGADIQGVFDASSIVMGSADFKKNGYIILSAVTTASSTNAPKVAWQCSGGGNFQNVSAIGTIGKAAKLPGNLVIDANDNVIIAEVFYSFKPMFEIIPIEASDIYKFAIFRPRLGALTSVSGGC